MFILINIHMKIKILNINIIIRILICSLFSMKILYSSKCNLHNSLISNFKITKNHNNK